MLAARRSSAAEAEPIPRVPDDAPQRPKIEAPEVAGGEHRDPRRQLAKNRHRFLRYLGNLGLWFSLAFLVLSSSVGLEAANYRLDRLNQALTVARAQSQLLSAELAEKEAAGNLLRQGAGLGMAAPSRVVVLTLPR